jgi:YD repeat-containing protein
MSFAYTYDAAGNRTSVTKDGGNAESYTLDALNRLTNVTYADGTTQAYTYDATGNPLSVRRLRRLRARLAR